MSEYIPVSPSLLFSETSGRFRIFLKQGDRFVLYTDRGDSFSSEKKKKLYDLDVTRVYMPAEDKPKFDEYFSEHFGQALFNEDISAEERSKTFYEASLHMVEKIFQDELPSSFSEEDVRPIREMTKTAVHFLRDEAICDQLGKLITYDFTIFHHSVNVFVLSMILLIRYEADQALMEETGVGAILHDVGKAKLPKKLLESPDEFDVEELALYRQHPEMGLELCKNLDLGQSVLDVIGLHHEVYDGTGFPRGLKGEELPLNVRIISAVNEYDTLVGGNMHGKNMLPFQALSFMSREMEDSFDQDIVVALVRVLGGVKD